MAGLDVTVSDWELFFRDSRTTTFDTIRVAQAELGIKNEQALGLIAVAAAIHAHAAIARLNAGESTEVAVGIADRIVEEINTVGTTVDEFHEGIVKAIRAVEP